MDLNNYDKIVELYHLMQDDEQLLKVFYTNDYPVPYKTLTLFPVQVDLYYYFHMLVQCLLLPHLTCGDIKAISMSYLKYLFYLATDKQKPEALVSLGELLLIVLRKQKTYIDENGVEKATISFELDKGVIDIEGQKFDSKDFNIIKKIILEQNAIEEPDETIPPELLKAYKEVEDYKLKQCKVKMGTLEDQINIIVARSSYRRDEIMRMTIRSFSRLLDRVDKIMSYEINSLLKPYMDKKDQEKIGHYMENTEKTLKEKCNEAFTDMDSLHKKVEG